jgi:hypothetical protein
MPGAASLATLHPPIVLLITTELTEVTEIEKDFAFGVFGVSAALSPVAI